MFLCGLLLLFLQMGYMLNAGDVPPLSIIAAKVLLDKPLQKDQKSFEHPVIKEIVKKHSISHLELLTDCISYLEPLTHSMSQYLAAKISKSNDTVFIIASKASPIYTMTYEYLYDDFSSAKTAADNLLKEDRRAFTRMFSGKFPSEVCTWEDIVAERPYFNKIGCTYNLKSNDSVTKYPEPSILFVHDERGKPKVGIKYSHSIEEEFDSLSAKDKSLVAEINYAACRKEKLEVLKDDFCQIKKYSILHNHVKITCSKNR